MKCNYVIFFLFISILSFSQADVAKQINLLFIQLRTQKPVTVDRGKLLQSVNYKEAADELNKYANDTVLSIRYEALNMLSQFCIKSKDGVLIKKSIRSIVTNSIFENLINNQIVNLLKRYTKNDFENDGLLLIKATLENQENGIGNLAKTYAFAGNSSVLMDLHNLLTKPKLTSTDKKDIKLALTRCGDEKYITKMNETLKQQVINDNLVYSALPDILYTNNKILYNYLLEGILSDAKKCGSANNDDDSPIICAYRLIEQIAPRIINFPVTINEKGEINSKDLNKTLIEVREWIKKNKETFEIDNTIY